MQPLTNSTFSIRELLSVAQDRGDRLVIEDPDGLLSFGTLNYNGLEVVCGVFPIWDDIEGCLYALSPFGFNKRLIHNKGRYMEGIHVTEMYRTEYYPITKKEGILLREYLSGISGADLDLEIRVLQFTQEELLGIDFTGWNNPRNKYCHPAIVDRIAETGFTAGTVLDLGCGNGSLTERIASQYPHAEVYALDILPENVKMTEQRHANIRGIVHNAQSLQSLGLQVDLVISNALFEETVLHDWTKETEQIVEGVYASLMVGGYFIATGYGPLTINRRMLETHGFQVEQMTVPKNLFTFDLPKQLYVARRVKSKLLM